MKKKLVASLAAAMVLGVAGTSFAAANPFTDVPAKHWAYDSVMKLSQAGIVDGYGDGTYKGDKLISRYEMAQMVAKAMARSDKADAAQKAQIDKLAAEFAEELNVLGVRVSALENKVGTVKITGDARVRWSVNNAAAGHNAQFLERFRLNLGAKVNENTTFNGRLVAMQHNEFGTYGQTSSNDATANDSMVVSDANLTTKNVFNSGATATVGRFSQKMLATGYFLDTTGMIDGVKVGFGNQLKMTVGFANFYPALSKAAAGNLGAAAGDTVFATGTYATSKATTLYGSYMKEKSGEATMSYDTKGIGLTTKFAKDWAFIADYAKNTAKLAKTNVKGSLVEPYGFVAKVAYKGANANVPGSWGATFEYDKFLANSYVHSDWTTATAIPLSDRKGLAVSYSQAIAKSVTFDAYQTFDVKKVSNDVKQANFSRLQVNYLF